MVLREVSDRQRACLLAALLVSSTVESRQILTFLPAIRGGQSDDNILSSPFLEEFQQEVHEIVSAYRTEVRETFLKLKKQVKGLKDKEKTVEGTKDDQDKEEDGHTDGDEFETGQEMESQAEGHFDEEQYVQNEESVNSRAVDAKDDETDKDEVDFDDDFFVGETDDEEISVIDRLEDDNDSSSLPTEDYFQGKPITEPRERRKKRKRRKRVPVERQEDEDILGTMIGVLMPSASAMKRLKVQVVRSASMVISVVAMYFMIVMVLRALARILVQRSS